MNAQEKRIRRINVIEVVFIVAFIAAVGIFGGQFIAKQKSIKPHNYVIAAYSSMPMSVDKKGVYDPKPVMAYNLKGNLSVKTEGSFLKIKVNKTTLYVFDGLVSIEECD